MLFDHPRIGRDKLTALEQQHIAGDNLGCDDMVIAPLTDNMGVSGQSCAQCRGRPLGLALLQSAGNRVDQCSQGKYEGNLRPVDSIGDCSRHP
jgi:hypothetical protein